MKRMNIAITGLNDASNFTKEASKVNGDVLLKKGIYVLDGKSIVSILAVDLTQGVTVEYPEDATDFENFIKNFEVA